MHARLILIASLSSLAASLTSCAAVQSKPVVITPKTAKVAEDIKTLNSSLSEIPDGELSYDDAIVRWAADRSAYGECRIKHKALADSINVLEAK